MEVSSDAEAKMSGFSGEVARSLMPYFGERQTDPEEQVNLRRRGR